MSGQTILKWLAPFLSGTVLGYLIVRVSTCEPERTSAPPPVVREPAPQAQAAVPVPVDAGAIPRTGSLEFLGATKAAPMVIGEALHADDEVPAGALGEGILGGSKSGTLDIRGIREGVSEERAP